jgi:hypothetical protein
MNSNRTKIIVAFSVLSFKVTLQTAVLNPVFEILNGEIQNDED